MNNRITCLFAKARRGSVSLIMSSQGRPSGRRCVECGEVIEGGVMIPEGAGPMHTDCWVSWMQETDPTGDDSDAD